MEGTNVLTAAVLQTWADRPTPSRYAVAVAGVKVHQQDRATSATAELGTDHSLRSITQDLAVLLETEPDDKEDTIDWIRSRPPYSRHSAEGGSSLTENASTEARSFRPESSERRVWPSRPRRVETSDL